MPTWDAWKQVTQFLESSRLALCRERQLWHTIELSDKAAAKIRASDGTQLYRARLKSFLRLSGIKPDDATGTL